MKLGKLDIALAVLIVLSLMMSVARLIKGVKISPLSMVIAELTLAVMFVKDVVARRK